jgi:hypothetical protein
VGFIPKNLSLDTAPLCGLFAPADFSLDTTPLCGSVAPGDFAVEVLFTLCK